VSVRSGFKVFLLFNLFISQSEEEVSLFRNLSKVRFLVCLSNIGSLVLFKHECDIAFEARHFIVNECDSVHHSHDLLMSVFLLLLSVAHSLFDHLLLDSLGFFTIDLIHQVSGFIEFAIHLSNLTSELFGLGLVVSEFGSCKLVPKFTELSLGLLVGALG
jgi:hypothetical protein